MDGTTQMQGENLFDWPVRKGATQRQTPQQWLGMHCMMRLLCSLGYTNKRSAQLPA